MANERAFNITGPCIPAIHYMADTRAKLDEIISGYVGKGEYFTINCARQYGKTTTLELLHDRLKSRYTVLNMNFEGKEDYFASLAAFAEGFSLDISECLKRERARGAHIFEAEINTRLPLRELSNRVSRLCAESDKQIVLMIDEVDRAADNNVFLAFLGVLREKYIDRQTGKGATFHSVILAGVHDIKNIKMKLRPEDERGYNSPWNIAARFDVDMSLSDTEIASMLMEYEHDHKTGMNIDNVSKRLYYYTSGYPFLVSLLCKIISDERLCWTREGVDEACKRALKTGNTLFDDVIKNITNHKTFGILVESILLRGEEVPFEISDPDIDRGVMFGILTNKNGKASVSNSVFEAKILNYFVSTNKARSRINNYVADNRARFIDGGKLDMGAVLNRFSTFLRSEYRDEDGGFIEREGRLLFLSFLKPIINGIGHYVVEPETRGSRRMDVVVFFNGEEHIVELKIWRGEQAASDAYDQLAGYLISREQKRGYLLSFCDNKSAPREGGVFIHKGCEITEVIAAYRDTE